MIRPNCTEYNHSVPIDSLLAALENNFLQGQAVVNSTLKQNPLCKWGQECVGWGVDIFDGRVAQSTLVTLTPDPSKTWNGFLAPAEADFLPFTKVEPNTHTEGTGVFPLPSDFTGFVNDIVSENGGVRGIFSSPWQDVYESYYNGSEDRALSVVQAQVALYEMTLSGSAQLNLERHFINSVQGLPDQYSTSNEQTIWNRFFELYGTSIVTSSTSGGLVEQRSRWNTWLRPDMNVEQLRSNAQRDFTQTTGLPCESGSPDSQYINNRILDSSGSGQSYWCYGGDPSTCGNGSTQAWQSTLTQNPVLLTYKTTPISELLESANVTKNNPALSTSMFNAVQVISL